MEGIKQWAFAICTAMVACGLAQMLLPKSSMERMFKLCVSVFFLCCLLSPVVIRNPAALVQVQEYSQQDIEERARRLTQVVEQQSDDAVRSRLQKIVEDKLAEKGIIYSDVTIHITTNGQIDGALPRVDITLAREYESQHEELREMLAAELGLDVKLGYA